MRHLIGLFMVMAILAISLIQPEINESIQVQNELALASCGKRATAEEKQEKQEMSLEEVWMRCDPTTKADNLLTSSMVGKIKISF